MDDRDSRTGGSCLASPIAEVLEAAIERHRAGRLSEAAALYEGVLAEDDTNVAALHLFGVLLHQSGDHARAEQLIATAADLRPDVAVIRASLAEASVAVGHHNQAIENARAAIRLSADDPGVRFTLGLAFQGLGRFDEAVDSFRRAIELQPEFAAAYHNLGNLLRVLGRLEEALNYLERAVVLAPGQALSRTTLGVVLVTLGRAAEALPHCEEAVRLMPDEAIYHNNLANVLRVLRRFEESKAAYVEAIRRNPGLAIAHACLGLVYLEGDRIDEAICLLSRAVELDPGLALYWENLAELHGRVEQFDAAITCWERVLELVPDDRAYRHRALGWALQEESRGDEAEAHYRAAVALEPTSAMPWVDLGVLNEERGHFAEAEAAYRLGIQLEPRCGLAHGRLAALLGDRLPEADFDAMAALLNGPDFTGKPRARLLFGLAKIFDTRGNYARAAECLREANELQLTHRPGYLRFEPKEHDRLIDNLIQGFDRAFFARMKGAGLDTSRQVFIVGLPRSGTTLLEQILASHPSVHGAGELALARRIFESLPAITNRSCSPTDYLSYLDAETVRELALTYDDQIRRLAGDRHDKVVDKTPDNCLYLGMIVSMFPNATIINCRRDMRDVALSCWSADFRSVYWANRPDHIATKFRGYLRLMDHWQQVLPTTIHQIAYEDTVGNIEGVARRLIAAVGLEWNPACLEFHRTARSVRTSSIVQVRKPLYSGSVARWKRYEDVLGDLFEAIPQGS